MREILIFFLLFFSTIVCSSKDKMYQCFWHQKNEDIFETRANDFRYSEDGMFYYCISNDNDNIYINIRVFDLNVQRMVTRSGMTIWINGDGKKEKKTGIKFPVGQKHQESGNNSGQTDGQNSQNFTNIHKMPGKGSTGDSEDIDVSSILLIGFSESGPVLVSALEKDNFKGSIQFRNDQYLYYELVLPKSKLPSINTTERKKNKLAIGFSHGSDMMGARRGQMSNRWSGEGMNGGIGGMRGGRGGMRGEGMSGGGHHRGMSGNPASQAYSNSGSGEFWLKDVRLAEEK